MSSYRMNKQARWAAKSFVCHENAVYSFTSIENMDEAVSRCWCCGRVSSGLQRCHIIPKSLGGTDEPSNVIPLCNVCHDMAPDVACSEAIWYWISSCQNPLTGIGLGFMWENFVVAKEAIQLLCSMFPPEQVEPILLKNLKLYSRRIMWHGGQGSGGVRIKPSTRDWLIVMAEQATLRELSEAQC